MDSEETRLYYILWIAVILLAVIIFYFIKVMIAHQARSIRAMQQQLDIQVKRSDEDRLRIVGELHDDIGPYLSALGQKIELISLQPYRAGTLLQEAARINEHVINSTRGLSRMLMPYNVKTNNLQTAINDFVDRLQPDQLEIHVVYDGIPLLKQDRLMAICRLIQEIIHNCIKHSRAARLKIDIRQQNHSLTIRTAEEGRATTARSKKTNNRGLGMELMECRVRLLQGSMHVVRNEGKGTRYVIIIPLSHKTDYNAG